MVQKCLLLFSVPSIHRCGQQVRRDRQAVPVEHPGAGAEHHLLPLHVPVPQRRQDPPARLLVRRVDRRSALLLQEAKGFRFPVPLTVQFL